jgi:hypothetical protein
MRIVSLALVTTGLFLYSAAASAQLRLVHLTACGSPGTTCTIPSTSSGNLILISWQIGGGASDSTTISRVTDNVGNVYAQSGDRSLTVIWYAKSSLPGATSIAITLKPGVTNGSAAIWEFSGVDRTIRPDQLKAEGWADLIASAGKTVSFKAAALAAGGVSACDLNGDGTVNVLDGQLAVNMIGSSQCTSNIERAGLCDSEVVSRVITAALGGPCITSNPHSVSLNWIASTSANVAGYNVYRGGAAGGPYTKLNSFVVLGTSYTDGGVQAGQTYYYVATTVDTMSAESAYSNVAAASVPSP